MLKGTKCSALFVVVAVAVIAGLGTTASLNAQAPTRIRLATIAPKGTSLHQALQTMGEKWRQASGGAVELAIYTDGTMGGEAETLRRIRVGQLQASLMTVTGLAEIEPEAVSEREGRIRIPVEWQKGGAVSISPEVTIVVHPGRSFQHLVESESASDIQRKKGGIDQIGRANV